MHEKTGRDEDAAASIPIRRPWTASAAFERPDAITHALPGFAMGATS
ncbi:hypothetical protein ACUSIJ_12200 [Pseudochelatococcus sp. B33]